MLKTKKYTHKVLKKYRDNTLMISNQEEIIEKFRKILDYTINNSSYIIDLMKYYDSISIKNLEYSDIYSELCWIIYNSGFKYEIIKKYWPSITKEFYSFDVFKVSDLNIDINKNAEKICKNTNFNNFRKAKYCIYNAKRIIDLDNEKQQCGGFKGYLLNISEMELKDIIKNIQTILDQLGFKGIGKITIFHFLKNIGIDIYKPDIHVTRTLSQLASDNKKLDIIQMSNYFEQISKHYKLSISNVDNILFTYGKLTNDSVSF